jgi:hypothetical protein
MCTCMQAVGFIFWVVRRECLDSYVVLKMHVYVTVYVTFAQLNHLLLHIFDMLCHLFYARDMDELWSEIIPPRCNFSRQSYDSYMK